MCSDPEFLPGETHRDKQDVGLRPADACDHCRLIVEVPDLDWSVRAHRRGLVSHYLPNLPVVHYGGRGRAQNRFKLLTELHRMNLYFYAKFYGRLVTRLVYLAQTAELRGRLVHLRLAGKQNSDNAAACRLALANQRQFMDNLH